MPCGTNDSGESLSCRHFESRGVGLTHKCSAKRRITPHQSPRGDRYRPLGYVRTLRQARFRFCRSQLRAAFVCSQGIVQSFESKPIRAGIGSDPTRRREMTQTGAGPAEIVRCKLFDSRTGRGVFDDFPKNLWCHPISSPDSASLVY
jgi:hypothetical protein